MSESVGTSSIPSSNMAITFPSSLINTSTVPSTTTVNLQEVVEGKDGKDERSILNSPLSSNLFKRSGQPHPPNSQHQSHLGVIDVSKISIITSKLIKKADDEKKAKVTMETIFDPLLDDSFYGLDILSDVKTEEIGVSTLVFRKILIIGGSGNVGVSLIKKYYKKYVRIREGVCAYKLTILSRDENKHSRLKIRYPEIDFIIGDIRNYDILQENIKYISPDVIIIAAAMKDITICEQNISECIKTNVDGVHNVIKASLNMFDPKNPHQCNLRTVVLISSDKACSPTTAFGISKSLAERQMIEASIKSRKNLIKFVCVRSPNVVNGRGHRLELYKEIATNPVLLAKEIYSGYIDQFPVNDIRSTSFVIFIEQLTELIHTAIEYGNNGETLLPVLLSVNNHELAKAYSKRYNKCISIIGLQPNEKLHEILLNTSEICRTEKRKIGEINYYILHPSSVALPSGFTPASFSVSGMITTTDREYDSEIFKSLQSSTMKGLVKYI